MHSFHHSRARIFFDIFCALTIAASCAIAWLQTGASALLAIAGVAAVFSLVHATDAGRRSQPVAAAAPDLEPAAYDQGDLLVYVASPEVEPVAEEAPKAPKAKRRSRKKKEDVKGAAEPALAQPEAAMPIADEPEIMEPEEAVPTPDEPEIMEPEEAVATPDEPEIMDVEEEHHATVTPLFEPQPLVRQQRAVFGRKAG